EYDGSRIPAASHAARSFNPSNVSLIISFLLHHAVDFFLKLFYYPLICLYLPPEKPAPFPGNQQKQNKPALGSSSGVIHKEEYYESSTDRTSRRASRHRRGKALHHRTRQRIGPHDGRWDLRFRHRHLSRDQRRRHLPPDHRP